MQRSGEGAERKGGRAVSEIAFRVQLQLDTGVLTIEILHGHFVSLLSEY